MSARLERRDRAAQRWVEPLLTSQGYKKLLGVRSYCVTKCFPCCVFLPCSALPCVRLRLNVRPALQCDLARAYFPRHSIERRWSIPWYSWRPVLRELNVFACLWNGLTVVMCVSVCGTQEQYQFVTPVLLSFKHGYRRDVWERLRLGVILSCLDAWSSYKFVMFHFWVLFACQILCAVLFDYLLLFPCTVRR
jgi:hypothetical protein